MFTPLLLGMCVFFCFLFLFLFRKSCPTGDLQMRFGRGSGSGGGEAPPLRVSCFNLCLSRSLLSIVNRKARAVYPCEAEHSSELSFEIGAIFEDGKC